MTTNTFPVELCIDDAGHVDYLIVRGAGTADDENGIAPAAGAAWSIINDDETAWDVWIGVAPSEDREPYDAALRAAGFELVGDDAARRCVASVSVSLAEDRRAEIYRRREDGAWICHDTLDVADGEVCTADNLTDMLQDWLTDGDATEGQWYLALGSIESAVITPSEVSPQ